MKRNFAYILITVLFMSWELDAHQPDYSSTVLMQQDDNSWILNVRAALTAFEYEVHNHYGDTSYTTPEGFQELVIDHMNENIEIIVNGGKVVNIDNGAVRLGHETNVFFKLLGMPDDLKSVTVINTTFKNIYNNQSYVSIVKNGIAPNKYTISNKNNHVANLKIDSNGVVSSVESVSEKFSDRKLFWAVIAIPIIFLGMLLLKIITKKKLT
ncbi:hypothetical protein N9L92_04225 [Saprospiraceae bacterium]|nr:hypothetical protein [Saprospiraceae bacterium]